jgi:ArsR family transcriptional regulator
MSVLDTTLNANGQWLRDDVLRLEAMGDRPQRNRCC